MGCKGVTVDIIIRGQAAANTSDFDGMALRNALVDRPGGCGAADLTKRAPAFRWFAPGSIEAVSQGFDVRSSRPVDAFLVEAHVKPARAGCDRQFCTVGRRERLFPQEISTSIANSLEVLGTLRT